MFHRVPCAVSEPCKATFVLVARYLSSRCMYIRAGSDAIRRQIMASHHGRGNRLMKNVRPVETFPIIKWNAKKIVPAIIRFPLSIASSFLSSFSFFFFFSFSLFAQRSGVAATGAPIHEILLITRSFETGKPCTTASWNYRVFCRRYASNGINSPTRTRHVARTIRCPRVCYYLSV